MTIKLNAWTHPKTGEVRVYINGAGVEGRPFITRNQRPA